MTDASAGVKLAEPRNVPDADASGLGIWQKLMVYAGEQSRHRGRPLSGELVRALRAAGAAPVLTVIADTSDRIREWFASSTS